MKESKSESNSVWEEYETAYTKAKNSLKPLKSSKSLTSKLSRVDFSMLVVNPVKPGKLIASVVVLFQ